MGPDSTVTLKLASPVPRGTSVGPQHETLGLPGYPARDFFAPSGTPVIAPMAGGILKLSGHDPNKGPIGGPHGALGWSIYIQGDDAHIYYLTHLAQRAVKLGDYVRKGQLIAAVANWARYGTPSHVHLGVH